MEISNAMNKKYSDLLKNFLDYVLAENKKIVKTTIEMGDPTRKPSTGIWKVAYSFATAVEKANEEIWVKIGHGNVFGYYYK